MSHSIQMLSIQINTQSLELVIFSSTTSNFSSWKGVDESIFRVKLYTVAQLSAHFFSSKLSWWCWWTIHRVAPLLGSPFFFFLLLQSSLKSSRGKDDEQSFFQSQSPKSLRLIELEILKNWKSKIEREDRGGDDWHTWTICYF